MPPGLSFKIEKGEFVALAGSNGAGKSTISRLSNGLLLPTAGEVTVGGFNTKATRASQIARKAGFLFRSSEAIKAENPDLPAFDRYDDLLTAIEAALEA